MILPWICFASIIMSLPYLQFKMMTDPFDMSRLFPEDIQE